MIQQKNLYAPIVLFVYKRKFLVEQVIDSLMLNPEYRYSDLIIFSDGPKHDSDFRKVEEVREYVTGIKGFNSIKIYTNNSNMGLANSFINGITQVLKEYKSAIFLEDDNVVSTAFLSFMNTALVEYEFNANVICVTGYSHPFVPRKKHPYFLLGAETWSMGTWQRGWALFNPDAQELMRVVDENKLKKKLSMYGTDFYSMLTRQIEGKIDSWGVRWTVSAICKQKYCYYPPVPHCKNIGNTSDGTHSRVNDSLLLSKNKLAKNIVSEFPRNIENQFLNSLFLRITMRRIDLFQKMRIVLSFEFLLSKLRRNK